MKQYGFGIIGLGMIADVHVKAINSLENARFAAGFDMVPGRAEKFCLEHGGKAYDDLDAFLSDPQIDVITITTPSGAHLEVAEAAMKAGKQVIVEKPMEITTERCDRMIAMAKTCGVKLGSVFQSRFHEAPLLVKQAIEQGRFGKLTICDAQVKWFRSQEYYDAVKWHGTWKMDGGGALMNQAIHAVDLLQWFCGPVEEVSGYTATLGHERIEVEDTAVAALRFKSGALGVIEGTTAAYPGFLKKLEICGSTGSAVLEEESLKDWQFSPETAQDASIRETYMHATKTGGGASDPKAIGFHGHALVFKDFLHALDTDSSPAITGEEARKAVAIIEAIYQSARTHQPVRL